MNNFKMPLLFASLLKAMGEPQYKRNPVRSRSDDNESKRQKTKRGATHKVGTHFRSRNLYGISPAEYRRRHLGKQQKRG